MTTEIRDFGPIFGAVKQPVTVALDGQSRKTFSRTFYRGESRNFGPSLDDFESPNFVEEFVLKGWLPPAPCITSATRITTFGSCFAMNIARHLSTRGYDLSQARAPAIYISRMGEGLVNCHSLLQQFEWALEDVVPPANLWHGYNAEHFGYDPDVQRQTRDVLLGTDFFIVTLGLSEIWYDKITGGVLWRAVPLQHFDPERHGFRVCSIEETKTAIQRMIALVRKHIPAAKLLFTLSPIPLAATFRPSSCLVANAASKAILRAALDEVIREQAAYLNRSLFYFPSYEIINELFLDRFRPDLRHPHDYLIDTVMRIFGSAYCVGEPPLTEMSAVLRDVRARRNFAGAAVA